MKHVLALITTILLSLTAFSNNGTDTLKLSHQVGKQVAIDLVSYDSTKEALGLTTKVLEMTENKSRMKDSVIKSHEIKTDLFRKQILMHEMKEESYQKMVSSLKIDIVKQKAKTKIAAGVGGFAVIMTAFIVTGLIH